MKSIVLALIRGYQRHYPVRLKRHRLYDPSCSRYAILAIDKYGAWRGLTMSWSRYRRCRPPVHDWVDLP